MPRVVLALGLPLCLEPRPAQTMPPASKSGQWKDLVVEERPELRPTQNVMPVKPSDYLRGTDDPTETSIWLSR
jgi:hypothetical protein